MINQTQNDVFDQIIRQVKDQVRYLAWKQTYNQRFDQILFQIEDQVWNL